MKVLDERDDGGPSERWSWILWFRDSDTCEDHGPEWHADCAAAGNPTCMYLQANRAGNGDDRIRWNRKASDFGHAQASVKLAYAYLKALPSDLPFDPGRAHRLFRWAVESSNEPDGHYGLAYMNLMHIRNTVMEPPTVPEKQASAAAALGSVQMMEVVGHLEEAARGGHVFAMFNLGVCHHNGYTGRRRERQRDLEKLAAEWFEASGLPEGFYAASLIAGRNGDVDSATALAETARILGFGTPWRKHSREHTGSGGTGAVTLNLPWPPLPDGRVPPEW